MFETGLSDFHKLTTTVLKQYFPKPKPKIVNYRDYRNFRNDEFRAELDNEILKHDINNIEYQHFLNIFIEILNKHAPMKIKYLRANQGKFMTKGLHKAIMKRSRLRNKFLRDRTEMSRKEYKKQRNFCVNLLKKAKKDHFANLDVNSVLDNRKFWQNVTPLFSNKVKAKTTIKLIENGETIDNEIKIAKIFNEYFVNTVKNLGILIEKESATFTENNLSEVEIALNKYKNHPSINAITKRMKNLSKITFSFNFISHDDVVKQLNTLKSKKASQKTDIPIKIVKENVNIISHFLYHNFNNSLSCSTFPTAMKYADATPIHKKDDKTDKTNYRPISILPNLSKVYERLMYNALARVCNYMDAKKRRVLMNAFITSQFSYCPLVWMFHSRTLNNRINKIHEKALRLVYKNETFSSFDDLLKRDKSVSIHQKNLQILATEIYKTKNDLGPKIMKDTFHFIQKPYNLRNDPELQRRRNRTVYFGTESISSLAPKIWELVPSDIRRANSLEICKEKIKSWTTDKRPCRLCKAYIGKVGFI